MLNSMGCDRFPQTLRSLFDLQRFIQNPKLEHLIADAELAISETHTQPTSLNEQDLELISAAGDGQPCNPNQLTKEIHHD